MTAGRRAVLFWLLGVGLGAAILARTDFSTDLAAFLPRAPSGLQRLLLEQLQSGPATRLVLVAVEGGSGPQRAQVVQSIAASLAQRSEFLSIEDGSADARGRDSAFIFAHRYLLSPAVTREAFDVSRLRAALQDSLDWVQSPVGALLGQTLLTSDPTGETLRIAEALGNGAEAHRVGGVWTSPDGRRALLLARIGASGSDLDAQARALALIRQAFDSAPGRDGLQLLLSGPAVFAVQARATIQREVRRVSLLGSALIVCLLALAYRSAARVLLGLLPVLSGALSGIAAVSLLCGVVYGITLGFGTTLIGESVDYSIYLFVQHRSGHTSGRLWPTIGLGMMTSIFGFMALVPSSFPGLAQLGIYSIAGLLAAAAVTRWVLPPLQPAGGAGAHLAALGRRIIALRLAVPAPGILVVALAVAAAGWLVAQRESLWSMDLAALSPVAESAQSLDAQLRRELGAPDVSNLVIVDGTDEQSALQGAERAAAVLDRLIADGVIGGYDSPARYLPSERLQEERRASLPDADLLRQRLRDADRDLPIRPEALEPFVMAVAEARASPDVHRASLAGTSLAIAVDELLWPREDRWHALLPLRAAGRADTIDIDRVNAALALGAVSHARAINLKRQTDALYGGYLREAIRLSAWGLAAIVVLLAVALRDPARVVRVMAPLLASVMVVSAGLVASGTHLNILHLVGLLLVVAVGSNYALFFDSHPMQTSGLPPLTVASLLIANATTVVGFGVLAFAHVPVLQALGATVAPGALLALWFSMALTPARAFAPQTPR